MKNLYYRLRVFSLRWKALWNHGELLPREWKELWANEKLLQTPSSR